MTGEYVLYLHAHGHKQREPAMPDGSWRSMLVSQPPVKTRELKELYCPGVRRHWLPTDRVAVMEKPTMGELVGRLRYDGVLL